VHLAANQIKERKGRLGFERELGNYGHGLWFWKRIDK
jgi:hypothetical protein